MKREISLTFKIILIVLSVCVLLTGCKGNDDTPEDTSTSLQSTIGTTAQTTQTTAETTQSAAETTAATGEEEPLTINYLTGLALAQGETGGVRACAVVINNLKSVVKYHSGLSSADVIYEYEVEGGITRLLAVYHSPENMSQIGSVRSARAVALNIAMGLDAVFVHAGGSDESYSILSSNAYTHIDGITDGVTFFRVSAVSNSIGIEHSMFTSASKLANKTAALKNAGVRMTLKSGYGSPFSFYETSTVPAGTAAVKVTTKYGSYQPYFKYDAGTGLYSRYEYGALHVDSLNGQTLKFQNVIVLSVTSVLSGDSYGRRNFNDVGSGSGVYVTNGVSVPVTWSKASATAPLKLFSSDGGSLKINKGKTFVSYVNGTGNITVSAS